jgi:hypothetical protein
MENKSSYYKELAEKLSNVLGEGGYEQLSDVQYTFWCPHTWENSELGRRHKNKTKRKLSVNFEQNIFKCWSCLESGRVEKLLKSNNILSDSQLKVYRENFVTEVERKVGHNPINISIPDYIPLSKETQFHPAFKYVKSRLSCTLTFLKEFDIGFTLGDKDRFSNCIIIPSYDKHFKPNYYFGRSWKEGSDWKAKPKENTKDTVFFESRIDWNEKKVFLVEGPFDALKLWLYNIPAIPLLGKEISEDYLLFKYLQSYNMNPILFFDRDAFDTMIKVSNYLTNNRVKHDTFFPYNQLDINDPAELSISQLKMIKERFL